MIDTIEVLQNQLIQSDTPLIIKALEVSSYRIPLKQIWRTASSELPYRQGFLVKIIINDTLSAIGECAPMPEIGTETYEQARVFFERQIKQLTGQTVGPECLSDLEALPATRFALETAFIALIEKYTGQPFYQRLNPEFTHEVKTNSMTGILDKNLISRIQQAQANGFHCHKIKLGRNDIEDEAQILSQCLAELSPQTRLRLDANKSWTMAQARWLFDYLAQQNLQQIDCIEEPLAEYQPEDYRLLQQETAIDLALDESFSDSGSLAHYPVRTLVLKPMAQGGIIKPWLLAQQAKHYKIKTIITSSIETGHGLWPITGLCAALNNDQYHGLATAHWLTDTLISPPEIHHGIITL